MCVIRRRQCEFGVCHWKLCNKNCCARSIFIHLSVKFLSSPFMPHIGYMRIETMYAYCKRIAHISHFYSHFIWIQTQYKFDKLAFASHFYLIMMHFNGWEFCCKYLAVRRNCNVCALIQMLPDTFHFVCVCISIENREWKPHTHQWWLQYTKVFKKGEEISMMWSPPIE